MLLHRLKETDERTHFFLPMFNPRYEFSHNEGTFISVINYIYSIYTSTISPIPIVMPFSKALYSQTQHALPLLHNHLPMWSLITNAVLYQPIHPRKTPQPLLKFLFFFLCHSTIVFSATGLLSTTRFFQVFIKFSNCQFSKIKEVSVLTFALLRMLHLFLNCIRHIDQSEPIEHRIDIDHAPDVSQSFRPVNHSSHFFYVAQCQ